MRRCYPRKRRRTVARTSGRPVRVPCRVSADRADLAGVVARTGTVRDQHLQPVITGATTVTAARLSTARLQWERRFVEVALARAGGNRSRAARDLGLTRQGLLKALERLRIGAPAVTGTSE